MPDFVYRGRVSEVLNSNDFVILLDLGFRAQTPRTFHFAESQDHYSVGTEVIALVSRDDKGREMTAFVPGDDPDGLAMLWHYPARLIKVIDGDTIDARVDLGCSVFLDERFRLSDIHAPEIFGVRRGEPGYARGVSAKAYLEARFSENGGAMTIVSSRQGKWRRWLAYVFVPDAAMSLNLELVDVGFADLSLSHHRPRKRSTTSRISVDLQPDLHTRLTERAKTMQLTPGAVLRTALAEFLRS